MSMNLTMLRLTHSLPQNPKPSGNAANARICAGIVTYLNGNVYIVDALSSDSRKAEMGMKIYRWEIINTKGLHMDGVGGGDIRVRLNDGSSLTATFGSFVMIT